MRTTITIEENLLARLKKRASATGSTVSRLIEDAVRVMMNRTPKLTDEEVEFKLVTYGAGGRFSRYDIDKTSSLLEGDDAERYARRRP